jgi:hypothetical protein
MPDLVTCPVNYFPDAQTLALAQLLETDLVAATNVQLGCYTNPVTWGRETTLDQITEATFGGYARETLAAWNGPWLDEDGNAYIISDLVVFVCDGTNGQGVEGLFLCKDNGGTQATATATGTATEYDPVFVITDPGTLYESAPRVTLNGATGSGATAHAEIAGGLVVAIHLDTPGTGYTTFTVVIDPPRTLVAGGNFSVTQNMFAATDALPTNIQLSIPPIAA